MLDLQAMPKTELHLHLEGAIPLHTFQALLKKYDSPYGDDAAALESRLRYRDFNHFLLTWMWMTQHVRTPQDFRWLARGVTEELERQGVVYAEVFFSPPDFFQHGLTISSIARAVRQGIEDAGGGIRVRLICDLCRQHGPELGMRWLEEVAAISNEADIVGIGLGGPEHLAPPEPYRKVYERAAQLGLRRVAHAGEAAGPASIWGAVRELGVERIGHGIRAVEDEQLLAFLAQSKLPLEVCPTSNVCTAVATWERHPIHRLLARGLRLTLSSDDPTFFGATIVDEYTKLRERNASDAELLRLARTGFEVAFLPESQRQHYLDQFDTFAQHLQPNA